jgi:hypothetical protein
MPELFFRWMDLDLPKNDEAGRQQDWRAAAQVCAAPPPSGIRSERSTDCCG